MATRKLPGQHGTLCSNKEAYRDPRKVPGGQGRLQRAEEPYFGPWNVATAQGTLLWLREGSIATGKVTLRHGSLHCDRERCVAARKLTSARGRLQRAGEPYFSPWNVATAQGSLPWSREGYVATGKVELQQRRLSCNSDALPCCNAAAPFLPPWVTLPHYRGRNPRCSPVMTTAARCRGWRYECAAPPSSSSCPPPFCPLPRRPSATSGASWRACGPLQILSRESTPRPPRMKAAASIRLAIRGARPAPRNRRAG
jgi:hypothetical protein